MFRRIFFVLVSLAVIVGAGWLALKRADISYAALETVYMSDTSRFLTVEDGTKIHYRDEGQKDAEAVVLVHGFAASLHTWEPLVNELKDDYRLISLDLPGHGLSRAPVPASSTGLVAFETALSSLVDELDLEDFVLVGNSMGGDLSWRYALKNENALKGLVLVGSAGWPEQAEGEDQSLVFRLLENPIARQLMKDIDTSMLIQSALRNSFYDEAFVTDEMTERYAALMRAPGHREGILAILAEDKSPATDAGLAELNVPTLVLHGDTDRLVPVESGSRFANAIPDAQLVIYENTGHLPHEEKTALMAQHLTEFIEETLARRPRDYKAGITTGLQP